MDVLPTKYLNEFLNSTATPFIDSDKRNAGYVRSAGKGAGNVAYMAIYEAGHMVSMRLYVLRWHWISYYVILQVPQDQPVTSLDMLQRWLADKPLAHGK